MSRIALGALCLCVGIGCGGEMDPPDAGMDAALRDGGDSADAGDDADAGDSAPDGGDSADASVPDGGSADSGLGDAGFDACVPPTCAPPPDGCTYVGTDPCVCGDLVCDGTPCTGDGDCPGGFCRAVMGSESRACHPYSAEGESCGGFTVPWGVSRCDPDTHACMTANPLVVDGPGVCLIAATIAELKANPADFEGHVVGVPTSYVTNDPSGCTELACTSTMPCCNTCTAGIVAKDNAGASGSVGLEDPAGVAYECTGTECMPLTTCTVAIDTDYRIIGTFTGSTIRVRSIQRLSFGP